MSLLRSIEALCENFNSSSAFEGCVRGFLQIVATVNARLACPSAEPPVVTHARGYESDACRRYERLALRTAYPLLLALCCAGNGMNLRVYSNAYFGGTTAVQLLRAKAVANVCFVSALVFEMAHAFAAPTPNRLLESAYWHSKPFLIALANLCGTLSTWFTTIVTVNTLLCVLLPFKFKRLCTTRLTHALMIGGAACSTLLHAAVPLTTFVESYRTRLVSNDSCERHVERFAMSLRNDSTFFASYERAYYWLHLVFVIILPIAVMLLCSVLVVTNMRFKELGGMFSSRRHCVIRLTMATTGAHLCLEGPAAVVVVAAALRGSQLQQHGQTVCLANVAALFLAVVNATIPFFLYLSCNEQFRQMSLRRSDGAHEGRVRAALMSTMGEWRGLATRHTLLSPQPRRRSRAASVFAPTRSLAAVSQPPRSPSSHVSPV